MGSTTLRRTESNHLWSKRGRLVQPEAEKQWYFEAIFIWYELLDTNASHAHVR